MTVREVQARNDGRKIPGEIGVWVFILLDLIVFGIFFGTIIFYRHQDPAAFAAGQDVLHVNLALVNTLFLVTGSLFVVRSVQGSRNGQWSAARRCLGIATATGVGSMAVKAFEYAVLLNDGHALHSDVFFFCYFAFTGIHLLYVIVGTAVLTVLRNRTKHNASTESVESGACYWHMVDLLWLILFPLLYLSA